MTDEVLLSIPARQIPVPASVSAPARAILAMGSVAPHMDWPEDESDIRGWRRLVEDLDMLAVDAYTSMGAEVSVDASAVLGCQVSNIDLDEALIYEATPPGHERGDDRLYLHMHGGAWQQGGGVRAR